MTVLGLDFGTSNTVGAFFDKAGELQLVRVRDDVTNMPSVVCFHGGLSGALVGESAQLLQVEDPAHTIVGVKRFLGRRFHSDYVGRYAARFSYGLTEDEAGRTALMLDHQIVSLETVASKIMARMRELASAAAGEEVERCVLACPAHFHFRQREALREAARLAGLDVQALINEPTAAALSHASGASERTVLVYDLGGGTFDTTVLRVEDGVVEVMATGGDAFLGGNEFDELLVGQLSAAFQSKTGIDLADTPVAAQRLAFFAERAKIDLSSREDVRVRAPCLAIAEDSFHDLDEVVTRRELETLSAPLIERTIGVALDTVRDAGLDVSDIDDVLLIGGQCAMPRLRARLREVFGERLNGKADAHQAVAIGAAIAGRGEDLLLDVLAVPICAMWPGASPCELVPANTAMPAREEIALGKRDQDLPVIIYEAMSPTAIDREVLGRVMVPAAMLQGGAQLVAAFDAAYGLEISVESDAGRMALELSDPNGPRPEPAPVEPRTVERPAPVVSEATISSMNIMSASGDPAGAESLELIGLDRFLSGVELNDVYRALDIEPLTPTVPALRRVSELGRAFKKRASQPGHEKGRAAVAYKVLGRIATLIRAPGNRIRYDFGHDHVYADERMARSGDPILDPSLLRATWSGLQPEKIKEARRLREEAARAQTAGDRSTAVAALRSALDLDPFDSKLRALVNRLEGS